jgi:hypothetical protein
VTIAVISCIIVILGIALFFIKGRGVSALLSGVSAVAALICALVPGILIQLCMMPEMTCRAVFRPIDIACSIIILVFAVIRLFFVIKEK